MRFRLLAAALLAAGPAMAGDYPAPAGAATATVTECPAAIDIMAGLALLGRHTYQGSCIAHTAWTPDGQFFVFSLRDSGGHQPWNSPIALFSVEKRKFLDLDVGESEAITDPDFALSSPSRIVFQTTKLPLDENHPVRRQLDLNSLD